VATSYDVVVVGGGNAAMCAALSAQESGARVLVLEKAPEAWRGGNGFFTAGGFRFAGTSPTRKPPRWRSIPTPRIISTTTSCG
jgi:succinate dehydrogenase/fumarate reductase flavoprotein subunit